MERKVQITADGSATIYIPEMDETYHSSHGAIQEAVHVFIDNGIRTLDSSKVRVFEMGLGTGLNALLTLKCAVENAVEVDYTGIEAFPVEPALLSELNYLNEIGEEWSQSFAQMHASDWGKVVAIHDNFQLTKVHQKIQAYNPSPNSMDIIYFDAFGPRAQKDMWHMDILTKMKIMLRPGGLLVTYCAMGQFKRDLKTLGFTIESRPGPPGKREMTLAFLSKDAD